MPSMRACHRRVVAVRVTARVCCAGIWKRPLPRGDRSSGQSGHQSREDIGGVLGWLTVNDRAMTSGDAFRGRLAAICWSLQRPSFSLRYGLPVGRTLGV
jgi:hypothetical protein